MTNHLEIKKIEPTVTPEGVVGSFRLTPSPRVSSGHACPFAMCSHVKFDKQLGVLTNNRCAVKACRILVRMMAMAEDECAMTPDPTNTGMRVCRKVKCCLEQSEESTAAEYELKTAGIAASVQWMLIAPADSCFLVTVSGRGSDSAFTVLAYLQVGSDVFETYKSVLLQHIEHDNDVDVQHQITDTPNKRLRTLTTSVPESEPPPPINKRRALRRSPSE